MTSTHTVSAGSASTGMLVVNQEHVAAARKLFEAEAEWQAMEQLFDELRVGYSEAMGNTHGHDCSQCNLARSRSRRRSHASETES